MTTARQRSASSLIFGYGRSAGPGRGSTGWAVPGRASNTTVTAGAGGPWAPRVLWVRGDSPKGVRDSPKGVRAKLATGAGRPGSISSGFEIAGASRGQAQPAGGYSSIFQLDATGVPSSVRAHATAWDAAVSGTVCRPSFYGCAACATTSAGSSSSLASRARYGGTVMRMRLPDVVLKLHNRPS